MLLCCAFAGGVSIARQLCVAPRACQAFVEATPAFCFSETSLGMRAQSGAEFDLSVNFPRVFFALIAK